MERKTNALETSTTVSYLLSPTQLENNKYYIKSIDEVI